MEPNQTFFKFIDQLKPGQVYQALGYDIVVIIDVLISPFTDKVNLHVRFPRNIGNARQYDILEISPVKHLGVIEWQRVEMSELVDAVWKRRQWLTGELEAIVKFAERESE